MTTRELKEIKELIKHSKKMLSKYKKNLKYAIKKQIQFKKEAMTDRSQYVKDSFYYYTKKINELCDKINIEKRFISNKKSFIKEEKENDK